jgi:hypothetical protein
LAEKGIAYNTFAEHFMISGLLCNSDIHWYGFHGDSDFAYLYNTVTDMGIPEEEKTFTEDL